MAITVQNNHPHWNFLLALDADLGELSRYIEFDQRNFKCFSLELVRLLFAAASEVDVVAKQCKAYPQIPDFRVISPRFGLTLQPWDEWRKKDGVPFWWTGYNKVKHERHEHYDRANLKNTLNAVAGLLVIVLFLYRQEAIDGLLVSSPQILRVHDDHLKGITVGEYYTEVWYKLDDR
jgi:hypothetical protein